MLVPLFRDLMIKIISAAMNIAKITLFIVRCLDEMESG